MEKIRVLIKTISNTPIILTNLLSTIPREMYSKTRVSGKWSIVEQVCHLTGAQQILIDRFKLFENKEPPHIKNYEPATDDIIEINDLLKMDDSLQKFSKIRQSMVKMLQAYPDSYWDKVGIHDSFEPYGTRILLMHCLNVDYAHLFSIEQLGLTKTGRENEIMTLP